MSDLRQASREFLIEFIELHRNLTCLWQIKIKDYSNKILVILFYLQPKQRILKVNINRNLLSNFGPLQNHYTTKANLSCQATEPSPLK